MQKSNSRLKLLIEDLNKSSNMFFSPKEYVRVEELCDKTKIIIKHKRRDETHELSLVQAKYMGFIDENYIKKNSIK